MRITCRPWCYTKVFAYNWYIKIIIYLLKSPNRQPKFPNDCNYSVTCDCSHGHCFNLWYCTPWQCEIIWPWVQCKMMWCCVLWCSLWRLALRAAPFCNFWAIISALCAASGCACACMFPLVPTPTPLLLAAASARAACRVSDGIVWCLHSVSRIFVFLFFWCFFLPNSVQYLSSRVAIIWRELILHVNYDCVAYNYAMQT